MAQLKDTNLQNPTTITFSLTAAQLSTATTLRIGTTLSEAGGRPVITVNGKTLLAAAAPSQKMPSRGFTRGAYRGFGEIYTFVVAGKLKVGGNSISIGCASGTDEAGWIGPSFIYDAVDLY